MYRYSLGCTSIWLIVPMSASLCCSMSITRILLCVLIGITCFVSTSCWPYVETESLHYKVDCWLARTMFISLCLFHSLDSGRAQLPLSVAIAFPLVILLLYSIGMAESSSISMGVWGHLCFRYLGFWWTYLAFVPAYVSTDGCVVSFCVASGLYFGHIVYSYAWILRFAERKEFIARQHYARGFGGGVDFSLVHGIFFSYISSRFLLQTT